MSNLLEHESLQNSTSQLAIDLWLGEADPNQTHPDRFKFEAGTLRDAMHFLAMPSKCASDVTISIFQDAFEIHATANKGECFAIARIPYLEAIALHQPFAITADREVLTRVSRHLTGIWEFHVPPDRSELAWNQDGWDAAIPTKPCEMPNSFTVATGAALCSGEELARGLAFANSLKPSHVPAKASGPHGSRIYDGKIMGGYLGGVAEYSSPEIPQSLNVAVPHSSISNAKHLLSRMKACRGGADAEKATFINPALGYTCGWFTHAANWPESVFSIFDRKGRAFFCGQIDPWRLANRATLHTIPVKSAVSGFFKICEDRPANHNIALLSEYPHGVAWSFFDLSWPKEQSSENISKVQYLMRDVAAAYALSPHQAELSLSEEAMLLTQHAEAGVCRKLLLHATPRRDRAP